MAAEDAPEMACVLDAKRRSKEQIIEEEQAHRAHVAALSNTAKGYGASGPTRKELWRLSALLVEHQAMLKSLPEKSHQETTQAPPEGITGLGMRFLIICPVL